MKVGLDVRISLISVLSTGGGGGELPTSLPPPKKSFSCQKLKAISNTCTDHI